MISLQVALQWGHRQLAHPLFLQPQLHEACRRHCHRNHLPAGPLLTFRELLHLLLHRKRQPPGRRMIMSMTPLGTVYQARLPSTALPLPNQQQGKMICTHHRLHERLHPHLDPHKTGPFHHRHHLVSTPRLLLLHAPHPGSLWTSTVDLHHGDRQTSAGCLWTPGSLQTMWI